MLIRAERWWLHPAEMEPETVMAQPATRTLLVRTRLVAAMEVA